VLVYPEQTGPGIEELQNFLNTDVETMISGDLPLNRQG
jgi:hypothetical protein